MPAEILRWPACGAAASSDSTRCEYCRAALATVACPACFGMMFVGAKFCSHWGASAARTEVTAGDKQLCPRCQVDMQAVMIGSSNLRECPQCQGVWADVPTLQQICADHEKQAAVLGMPAPPPETVAVEKNFRYVPCPVCHKLMNRLNFAHCSNVIVDVCKAHGTCSTKMSCAARLSSFTQEAWRSPAIFKWLPWKNSASDWRRPRTSPVWPTSI